MKSAGCGCVPEACERQADGLPSSDGLSRLLFLERHGHRGVRGEANPLPLDTGDQPDLDEMRVAFVLALAAVALGEPDAPVGDSVDGADVDAVRANHFHVLGDLVRSHLISPLVQTSPPCRVVSDFIRAARILSKRFMMNTP